MRPSVVLCLLLACAPATPLGVELSATPLGPTRCSATGVVKAINHAAKPLAVSAVVSRAGASVRVPGFLEAADPRFVIELPAELPPGTTELTTTFIAPPDGSVDEFMAVVELTVGSVTVPLELRGLRSPALLPPGRIDFGAVPLGATRSMLVVIPEGANARLEPPAAGLRLTGNQLHFTPTLQATSVATLVLERACEKRSSTVVGSGVRTILTLLPPELDFGVVPVTQSKTLRLEVLNQDLSPATLNATAMAPFEIVTPTGGVLTVPAATRSTSEALEQGSATFTVRFAPTTPRAATGQLVLSTSVPSQPSLLVPLAGKVGGPHVASSTTTLTFEPAGSTARLELRNVGTGTRDPNANLFLGIDGHEPYFELVHVSGVLDNISVRIPTYNPSIGIPPGTALTIIVSATAGPSEHDLRFFTNDVDQPVVTVRLVVP